MLVILRGLPAAKLTASNAAMDNAGLMNSSPAGRLCRDARILEIGEGASEAQRVLIAREPGLGGG